MRTFYCSLFRCAHARQRAQGLVEYALILVIVSITAIAGLIVLGPQLANWFSTFATSI